MSFVICEFCDKKFLNKYNLLKHQRTTKSCLKLQEIKNNLIHTCEICCKNFTTTYDFNIHIKTSEHFLTLENKYKELNFKLYEKDNQIKEKDNQIKDLQKTIEKLANRPTTTIKNTQNNYIQNMKNITDDILNDNINNLTIDHILKGSKGYAEYALDFPLKNRICCVDYSRRKVKFKDINGNIITDPEMSILATKFFKSIKDKNKNLICEYGAKIKDQVGDDINDLIEILDYKSNVDSCSEDGLKTDFYHDFVKNICSKTIVD